MSEQLRYLGIGLEAQYGVAVAADIHVDVASTTLDSPSGAVMKAEGGIGRVARTMRPGIYVSQGSTPFAVDIDTLAYLFILACGGEPVVTGPDGDGFYTYESTPTGSRLMRSATLRCGKDLFEQVFPGQAVGQLTLTIEKGFAMASIDTVGGKDSNAAIKEYADLLLPEGYPLAFYDMGISIGGTDRSADVEKIEIIYNNNPDAEAGVAMGSRFPRKMWQNGLDITVNLDIGFSSLDEKRKFWGGPVDDVLADRNEPGETIFDEEIIVTADAGEHGSATIVLPACVYQDVPIKPTGRDRVLQSVSLEAREDDEGNAFTATVNCKKNITNAVIGS